MTEYRRAIDSKTTTKMAPQINLDGTAKKPRDVIDTSWGNLFSSNFAQVLKSDWDNALTYLGIESLNKNLKERNDYLRAALREHIEYGTKFEDLPEALKDFIDVDNGGLLAIGDFLLPRRFVAEEQYRKLQLETKILNDKITYDQLSDDDKRILNGNTLLQQLEFLTWFSPALAAKAPKAIKFGAAAIVAGTEAYKFYDSFKTDEQKQQEKKDELMRNEIKREVWRGLETIKNFDPTKDIYSLMLNATDEQKQNYYDAISQVFGAMGIKEYGIDDKGQIYIDTPYGFAKVERGFLDSVVAVLDDNKWSFAGAMAGAEVGAKGNFKKNWRQAAASAAIGAFLGGGLDYVLAMNAQEREIKLGDMLRHAAQEGTLSVIGDSLVAGAIKLMKTTTIEQVKQFAEQVIDYTPFAGFTKRALDGNKLAAIKLVNSRLSQEEQQAIKDLAQSFGGEVTIPKSQIFEIVEKIKNPVFKKGATIAAEIFTLQGQKDLQQTLLSAVRADKSGNLMAFLTQAANSNPFLNQNLQNLLADTTQKLSEQLAGLGYKATDARDIIRNLIEVNQGVRNQKGELVKIGTYEDAIYNVLAKHFDNKFKVKIDPTNFKKFKADLEASGVKLKDEPSVEIFEKSIYNENGVTFEQLANIRQEANKHIRQSKNATYTNRAKLAMEKFIKADIQKGIDDIFKQDADFVDSAKALFDVTMSDYAKLKDLQKLIKDTKILNANKDAQKALETLIENLTGQGNGKVSNLEALTRNIPKENLADFEVSILMGLFEKSIKVIENFGKDAQGNLRRVFDSTAFIEEFKKIKGIKSQAARDFIDIIEQWDALFKNDYNIAKGLKKVVTDGLHTSIATTYSGLWDRLVLVFTANTFMRLMPHIPFATPINQMVQGAAVRYHFKKALQNALSVSDFKLNLKTKINTNNEINTESKKLLERLRNEASEVIEQELEATKTKLAKGGDDFGGGGGGGGGVNPTPPSQSTDLMDELAPYLPKSAQTQNKGQDLINNLFGRKGARVASQKQGKTRQRFLTQKQQYEDFVAQNGMEIADDGRVIEKGAAQSQSIAPTPSAPSLRESEATEAISKTETTPSALMDDVESATPTISKMENVESTPTPTAEPLTNEAQVISKTENTQPLPTQTQTPAAKNPQDEHIANLQRQYNSTRDQIISLYAPYEKLLEQNKAETLDGLRAFIDSQNFQKLPKDTQEALKNIYQKQAELENLWDEIQTARTQGVKAPTPTNENHSAVKTSATKNNDIHITDYISFDELQQSREVLKKELQNIRKNEPPLVSGDGVEAVISKRGASEMLSDKAIEKSIANGFTPQEHLDAVKNIREIFSKARYAHAKMDDSNQNVSIFRFNALLDDKNVLFTLKEEMENGKKIYSLELENLEAIRFNPSGKDTNRPPTLTQRDTTAATLDASAKISNETIPQNAKNVVDSTPAESATIKNTAESSTLDSATASIAAQEAKNAELQNALVETQNAMLRQGIEIEKQMRKDMVETLSPNQRAQYLKNIVFKKVFGEAQRSSQELKYIKDTDLKGYVTDSEVRSIADSLDELRLSGYTPKTQGEAIIYEWEKDGVKFRLNGEIKEVGKDLNRAELNFYSNRNLADGEFENITHNDILSQVSRDDLARQKIENRLAYKNAALNKGFDDIALSQDESIPFERVKDTMITAGAKEPFSAEVAIVKKRDVKPNFENTETQGRLEKQDGVIKSIIQNFDANRHFYAEGGMEGAPIITRDGKVIAGNHRAEAIKNFDPHTNQVYKQKAKEILKLERDLADDEMVVRVVNADMDSKKIIETALESNAGLENSVGEVLGVAAARFKEPLEKLNEPIEWGADVNAMQNFVARRLNARETQIEQANLALLSKVAKNSQIDGRSVAEALQTQPTDPLTQRADIVNMFKANAGAFYNIARDIDYPNIDLSNYLTDAIVTAIRANPLRKTNYEAMVRNIGEFLTNPDGVVMMGQTTLKEMFDGLKGQTLGYSLRSYAERANGASALYEDLLTLRNRLATNGDLLSGRMTKTALQINEYDVLRDLVAKGQPTKETSQLLTKLDELEALENKLIEQGRISKPQNVLFQKPKAKETPTPPSKTETAETPAPSSKKSETPAPSAPSLRGSEATEAISKTESTPKVTETKRETMKIDGKEYEIPKLENIPAHFNEARKDCAR